jgi:glycosyltransferase involved in cell wall biosynthesis
MIEGSSNDGQSMKVCFVVDEIPTESITSGANMQCYLVGRGLAERGWDVKFGTFRRIAGKSPSDLGVGPRGVVWVFRNSRNLLRWTISLIRFLWRTDPEIMVVTGAINTFNGTGVLYSICFRKKLVYRAAHIWDADYTFMNLQMRGSTHLTRADFFFRRQIYLLTLKYAHAIVASDRDVAEAFKRILPHKNIRVIPNGNLIESNRESPSSHILWIARFERVKNPILFVRLAQELPHLRFVMCGFGSLFDEIAEEADHLANLTILDSADNKTKRELLASAVAVVNTSVAEGFPNTLIEAGMNAAPYVSFIDPDEVICRNRLGFHVNSFPELKQKVELLVQDRALREQLGINIRAYVEKHHAIQDTVAKYDRLLRYLLPLSNDRSISTHSQNADTEVRI